VADTLPTPPIVEPPVWDAIPARLAQAQQWVLWKFEWDTKRNAWLKVPYYVAGGRRTGDQGSDRDRERLATLPVVRRAFERAQGTPKPYTGIGFGFLPGDGLIGIDLDKCIDPDTGKLGDRAAKIVQAFHSFTELSPSGKGLHIYLEGHTTTHDHGEVKRYRRGNVLRKAVFHGDGAPLWRHPGRGAAGR
jgi:putative DNA primase/helicase